jgi:hypothetical protein
MSEDAEVDFGADMDDIPSVTVDAPIESVVVKEGGLEVSNLTRFFFKILTNKHVNRVDHHSFAEMSRRIIFKRYLEPMVL